MDASHFEAGLLFGAVTSDPSVARRVGDKRVSHLSGCAHLEIALLVGWLETLKKKGGWGKVIFHCSFPEQIF